MRLEEADQVSVSTRRAKRSGEAEMEFRWVALIALWTFLSGPCLTDLWAKTPPARVAVVKDSK